MHYLSSVYFVNQLLHVSGIFVAHRQEVYCIYTTICTCCAFSVDCLLARLRWNQFSLTPANIQSTEKHNTLAGLRWKCFRHNPANRQSTEKVTRTNYCTYIYIYIYIYIYHNHAPEGLGMLSCSLILKMKLVPPSLPRSSYVSSSFWFTL